MSLKEKDIRPEELMEMKKPALEHDKKYLRDRLPQFVTVNCVACGSSNYIRWATKESFTYDECCECRTIFMNPRASEELLGDFYKQSQNYDFWNKYIFPASDAVRKQKIFKPRAQRTIDFCKKYSVSGGSILEIGSAYGTFCEVIMEHQFFERVVAVEPTPGLAQTCRSKGIEVYEETIEELTYERESADVVASFEVIEHLSNPHKFIKISASYLKKGGLFICTCPNGLGLGTLVLKEQAKVVDHEHVNYFNPMSLQLLLEKCSIETLEVLTPGELDVELLLNEYGSNPGLFKDQPFFSHILSLNNDLMLKEFQNFIKEYLLSSHLWIVGRKR